MPETAEPAILRTEDGYIFHRQEDGSYSDGDPKVRPPSELHAAHPPREERWYDDLLKNYPPPWTYKPHAAECGNGSRIDVIEDAKGNCVVGTYGSSWTLVGALWAWYESVKDQVEQEAAEMAAAVQRMRDGSGEDEG